MSYDDDTMKALTKAVVNEMNQKLIDEMSWPDYNKAYFNVPKIPSLTIPSIKATMAGASTSNGVSTNLGTLDMALAIKAMATVSPSRKAEPRSSRWYSLPYSDFRFESAEAALTFMRLNADDDHELVDLAMSISRDFWSQEMVDYLIENAADHISMVDLDDVPEEYRDQLSFLAGT